MRSKLARKKTGELRAEQARVEAHAAGYAVRIQSMERGRQARGGSARGQ
jgi:hypothetical protein